MKHILGKNEFKQLKQLSLIVESGMDFSNKVGWSDCLVGRFVNKLFSFAAKNAYNVILNRLKVKIDDQFLKAILLAMYKYNQVIPESEKSAEASIEIDIISNENENEKLNVNVVDNFNFNIRIKTIEELKKWKTNITSPKKSTWQINDLGVGEQLDPLVEIIHIKVTAENGTTTSDYTLLVNIGDDETKDNNTDCEIMLYKKGQDVPESFQDMDKKTKTYTYRVKDLSKYEVVCIPKSEQAKVEPVERQPATEEIKFNVTAADEQTKSEWICKMYIKGETEKVQTPKQTSVQKFKVMTEYSGDAQFQVIEEFLKTFKAECVLYNEYGIIITISKALKQESEKLVELVANLKKVENPSTEIAKFVENIANYESHITKLNEYSNKMVEKANTISEDKRKEISQEEYSQFKTGTIGVDEIDKYREIIENIYKKFKENENKYNKETRNQINNAYNVGILAFQSETAKNSTDSQRYYVYSGFKKMEEVLMNESNTITAYDNMIIEKYTTDIINEASVTKAVGGSDSIKNILGQYTSSDKEGFKDAMAKYGKVKYDQIDPEKLMLLFSENIKLREEAVKMVDKEALKEIALRAQWIYDTTKYTDKRNTAYTRVNWTVTDSDAARLENTWKKLITKSKSAYRTFFDDENGVFPKTLDPIWLINNDEDFRKKFDSYSSNDASKKTGLGNTTNLNPPDPGLLKKIKLTLTGTLADGQFGVVVFRPLDNFTNDLCMVVQKSIQKKSGTNRTHDLHAWKFVGLFNYNEIYNKVKDLTDETQIQETIKSNNYSGLELIKKIADADMKRNVTALYDVFRPSQNVTFKNATNPTYVYTPSGSGDKLATYFITTQNVHSSNKNFIQLNVVKSKNNNNQINSYITKTKSDSIVVNGYVDVKNSPDDDKHLYQFKFNVSDVMLMESTATGFWGVSISNEDEKTKMFTENEDAKNMVDKLL